MYMGTAAGAEARRWKRGLAIIERKEGGTKGEGEEGRMLGYSGVNGRRMRRRMRMRGKEGN